jgi:DNA-binding MarR family transcriptional regulator
MSAPDGFDELIHPTTRLSLVALLAASTWAEFSFAKDALKLSDSALSKQVSTLEDAGYVEVRKEGAGRHRRTKLRLTEQGRVAFEGHVAALRQIIETATIPEQRV